jgi:hypothetical protein
VALDALTCPSCGAPVTVAPGADGCICRYCDRALRLRQPASAASSAPAGDATAARTTDAIRFDVVGVAPAVIARVKELVLQGDRAAAAALYAREAACDERTADAMVEGYALDAVWSTLDAGRLNGVGLVLFVAAVALALGAATALAAAAGGAAEIAPTWAAALAGLLGLAWATLFARRALRTMRYRFARSATARVLRCATVGRDAHGDALFRLLLEVADPTAAPFRAETLAVLSPAHAAAMQDGHRVRVRYFASAPSSVVYDGEP